MADKEIGFYGTSSLVCAALGIFIVRFIGVFGLVFPILAVIFGIIGVRKKQKYAKAGLVIGVIEILLILFLLYILGAVFSKLHSLAIR